MPKDTARVSFIVSTSSHAMLITADVLGNEVNRWVNRVDTISHTSLEEAIYGASEKSLGGTKPRVTMGTLK